MNIISGDAQAVYLFARRSGELTLELTPPVMRVSDDAVGDSVTLTMVAEPPEDDYDETRVYRYDETTRSFSILDAVFARGEVSHQVAGLANTRRYAWLPAAFDQAGDYIPAAVLTARVTDGSPGAVRVLKDALVQLLRNDAVLKAYHPDWQLADPQRCRVFDNMAPAGRSTGRAPYIEVETDEATRRGAFLITVRFKVRLVTTGDLDLMIDDTAAALTAAETRNLNERNVLDVRVALNHSEHGFPLKQAEMAVEVDAALKM